MNGLFKLLSSLKTPNSNMDKGLQIQLLYLCIQLQIQLLYH